MLNPATFIVFAGHINDLEKQMALELTVSQVKGVDNKGIKSAREHTIYIYISEVIFSSKLKFDRVANLQVLCWVQQLC